MDEAATMLYNWTSEVIVDANAGALGMLIMVLQIMASGSKRRNGRRRDTRLWSQMTMS